MILNDEKLTNVCFLHIKSLICRPYCLIEKILNMEKNNTLIKTKTTITNVSGSNKKNTTTGSSKKAGAKASNKKVATRKTTITQNGITLEKIIFQLRFTTTFGQELYITGNHSKLGKGDMDKAIPLQFFNDEFWYAVIE